MPTGPSEARPDDKLRIEPGITSRPNTSSLFQKPFLRKAHAGCPPTALDPNCCRRLPADFRRTPVQHVRMRSQMQAAGNWDKIEGVITVSKVDQPPSHVSTISTTPL